MKTLLALENHLNGSKDLELALERLATEASLMTNVAELFQKTLPNFVKDIRLKMGFMADEVQTKDLPASSKELHKKYGQASKRIPHLNFLLYGDRAISIPEDFEGHLLDYLKVLTPLYAEYSQLERSIVGEYNLILAAFTTNKEAKYSIQDHTRFFEQVKRRREAIGKDLHKFFPKDTGKSKKRLRDVLRKWGELEPVVNEAVKLNTLIVQTNLHELKGGVQRAVDTLDVALQQLKTASAAIVSPEAAKNLAQGAFEVGKAVELFGVLYHDARIAVHCVDQLLDTINNPL
jgi:hypothetical protein